ncbi:MAG: hypothetical protein WEC84_03320 [Candidatus Andersenbacteria bacterium]
MRIPSRWLAVTAIAAAEIAVGVIGVRWYEPVDGRVESATTFAEDLPRVKSDDVNKHFRSVFGRTPTVAEWRYWFNRTQDTPILMNYLAAMRHYQIQGSSPAVRDEDFKTSQTALRMQSSTRGEYLKAGDKVNVTVTVVNDSPSKSSGVLQIAVNTSGVDLVTPLLHIAKPAPGGKRLIRHRYTLAAGESLDALLQISVPASTATSLKNVTGYADPALEIVATIDDLAVQSRRVFRVTDTLPTNQQGATYNEQQVSIIFLKAFDRQPTSAETLYWRQRLTALDNRLDQLQGAIEVARSEGRTGSDTLPVHPDQLNALFRAVYGRNPSVSEWQYWAGRRLEKKSYGALRETMTYHRNMGISHD